MPPSFWSTWQFQQRSSSVPPVPHHEGFNSIQLETRQRMWCQKENICRCGRTATTACRGRSSQIQRRQATTTESWCTPIVPHAGQPAPQHRLDLGQRGRRGKTTDCSVLLVAVVCEAHDPCCENTACAAESSFTMSPRSTTRPVYFWCFGSTSAFLR